MATTAQRLAALEAITAALKAADVALGARVDKEVNARVVGDTALAGRLAALEKALPPSSPLPPVITPIPTRQIISVSAGQTGILVPAGSIDWVISDKDLVGPQTGAPVKRSGEFGVHAAGTASNPIKRLTLRDMKIAGFGWADLWLEYVQTLVLGPNLELDDSAYAALMLLSCADVSDSGLGTGNKISNVGIAAYNAWRPGDDVGLLNAYGIAMSAEGGPNTEKVSLKGWSVDNVPGWHGIDGHSAAFVAIEDCSVTRCNRAYWSSSPYGRAHDWVLNRNKALQPTKRPDVLNTSPYNEIAFTLFDTDRISGSGNVAQGWPSGNDLDVRGSTDVTILVQHA